MRERLSLLGEVVLEEKLVEEKDVKERRSTSEEGTRDIGAAEIHWQTRAGEITSELDERGKGNFFLPKPVGIP
jgi:hypothetical protein